ncbi:MAG: phosphoribosylanthranilate isomerase, partial [uncultured bacterium]
KPGSGTPADFSSLENTAQPFLLAGGVTTDNAWQLLNTFHPIGLDVASGIETHGRIDINKVTHLVNLLSSC